MEAEVQYTERICDYLKDAVKNPSLDLHKLEDVKHFIDKFDELDTIPFRVIRQVYTQNKQAGITFSSVYFYHDMR